jgi:putative ABC transport system permease protein
MMPAGVPRSHEIAVNGTVLAFSAVVTVMAGMLFGSIPALRATRFVNGVATSGKRTTAGPQHHRVAGALVATEVALAVVLVICATLLVRSFNSLRSVEPGFETHNIVAARLTPPAGSYRDRTQTEAFYTQALGTISALPGVRAAAAVDKLPLAQPVWGGAIRVEGQFEDARRPLPEFQHWQMVTPAYFTTMGIPVRGRAFTDADREGALPVAIISESFARRFWPNETPIGKRIGYPYESPWLTIVGVVPDTRQDSLREAGTLSMYVPWQQRARMSGTEMWLVARTSSDAASLAGTIRHVVHEIDRTVPVSDIRTMDAVVSGSMQTARFITLVVSAFAIGALILGAIGVYGVMSYLVGQRMREMGIRLALGAPAPDLIALVIRRAAVMAGAGAVIGVAAALLLTRSMRAMLYGISPTDPLTFVAVPLFFLLVAALASYSPARRASRLDPVRVLRAD